MHKTVVRVPLNLTFDSSSRLKPTLQSCVVGLDECGGFKMRSLSGFTDYLSFIFLSFDSRNLFAVQHNASFWYSIYN